MSELPSSNLQNKLAAALQPKTDNKKAVLDKLVQLQNNYSLAIHVWEDESNYLPDLLENSWMKIDAKQIPNLLHTGNMPLLSMSLVPSQKSGKSIIPYDFIDQITIFPGYLFTFDQDIADPAKVVRVHPEVLRSGSDLLHKNLKLKIKTDIAELDDFYKHITKRELFAKIANEQQGKYTKFQLNLLGESHIADSQENKTHVCNTNEIIAAVSKKHICALVIPIGFYIPEEAYENEPLKYAIKTNIYLQSIELAGALSGLIHLEKDMDLPVVLYNVTPANTSVLEDYKQGDFIYVGQGKKELTEKMLKALKFLDAHRDDITAANRNYSLNNLKNSIKTHTDIDIEKPLSEQQVALANLTKDAGLGRGRK